jgi:hypothetical protein
LSERPDIWKVADALQMNLRACAAQLVELRSMLSHLDIPASTEIDCPVCGLRTKGPRSLAEHLYLSHDGTVPETWERAERISD